MERGNDAETTEREIMEAAAEQILRDHLPLHRVDQHMAAMHTFVEYEVTAHKFDENRVCRWTVLSVNLAEAATDAFHAFETDGWIITEIRRKSGFPWDDTPATESEH
jgi:hypothetical protein